MVQYWELNEKSMSQEYNDNVDKKDFALEVQTIYGSTMMMLTRRLCLKSSNHLHSDNVDKKDFALEVETIYRNTTGATWLFSITIILEKVEKATPCAISPSLP